MDLKKESNIEYLRQVLEDQIRLTADGTKFVPVDALPRDHRYYEYQAQVNGSKVPTQDVIKKYIAKNGQEYRFQTAPHPVPRFQDRDAVPEY